MGRRSIAVLLSRKGLLQVWVLTRVLVLSCVCSSDMFGAVVMQCLDLVWVRLVRVRASMVWGIGC